MSESEQQREYSPLLSERGVTTISDTVVSQVAGMAAQEVEGVHMGGGTSRTAGGVLGSITGSESKTSGISVEVGRTETAIDLKMGIEYNKNILQTVEEVRRRITERIQETTGLRIKELNATITDITFPEKEATRRLGPPRSTSEKPDDRSEGATESAPEARTMPESERDATQVEPTSQTHTEGASGPVSEEEVSEEGRPLEEGETQKVESETGEPDEETTRAETQTSDEATSAPEEEAVAEDRPPEAEATTEQPTEEVAETTDTTETTETAETTETTEIRAETETPEEETPEEETPEARMRRRAEERARRRRSQDS